MTERNAFLNTVLATQLSVIAGSFALWFLFAFVGETSFELRPEALLTILLVAGAGVNVAALIVFYPAWKLNFISVRHHGFVWQTSLAGGLGHLVLGVLISVLDGGVSFLQYFSTFAFAYLFLVGGLYAFIFALVFENSLWSAGESGDQVNHR